MKIRFIREIALPCVKVWPVEYDGEAVRTGHGMPSPLPGR